MPNPIKTYVPRPVAPDPIHVIVIDPASPLGQRLGGHSDEVLVLEDESIMSVDDLNLKYVEVP